MGHSSGRGLLVVLAVLAVLAVGALLIANPFASTPDGGSREEQAAVVGETAHVRDGTPDVAAPPSGSALVGAYGEGDRGAVRLRIVDVRTNPIADQPVRLVARGGEELSLSTAVNGVAQFEKVSPGRGWRVEIAAKGFHAVTIQGVGVKARETTDLGDVVLGVNLVLRGRVVDPAERGIEGASVEAYAPARSVALEGLLSSMISQAVSSPSAVDRAISDADGWFTLGALPDGSWRLVARKAGHATAQESEVVLSQERPAKTLVLRMSPGATLKGKVSDEAGKAVAGARVLALRDVGGRWNPAQAVERESARTDEQGRYAIDTLAAGSRYRFGVLADGYASVFDTQAQDVETSGERDFTLLRGGSLAGVVKDRATGDPVANASVTAVTGQFGFGGRRGGVRGGGEDESRTAAAVAVTDDQGRFRIEALLPGPVAIGQVKASGYVPVTASAFMGGGSWGEVAAGETLEVEVALERGGAVEGTLLDAGTGAPIAAATVGLVPRENPFVVLATGTASATTDAAGKFRVEGVKAGKYGVVASAPGYASPSPTDEATTVTVPEDGGTATTSLRLTAAGAVTGVVKDMKGEIVAGARVRLRGAPARGGGGARGGWGGGWRAFLPGAVTSDLTDQDGRFRIADVASDERWILAAESDEHVPLDSEPFSVEAGETKEVNLVVMGGGAIQGRVVDDRGSVVSGARVRVGSIPSEVAARRSLTSFDVERYLDPEVHVTDTDGRFIANRIRPGRAAVRVEKEGFAVFFKRDVEVRAEETVSNYGVALSRGEVVEGVVKGADGRPLQGAMVAVTTRANPMLGEQDTGTGPPEDTVEPQMTGRTDHDGKFRVENVLPGRTYTVAVWFAPQHLGWGSGRNENAIRRDVSVPAHDVEFRLEAAPAGSPSFPGGFTAPGGRGGGGGGTAPVGGRTGGGMAPPGPR